MVVVDVFVETGAAENGRGASKGMWNGTRRPAGRECCGWWGVTVVRGWEVVSPVKGVQHPTLFVKHKRLWLLRA
jgi:hypothetical protein